MERRKFIFFTFLIFPVFEASSFRGHFTRKADLKLTLDPFDIFSGDFSVYDCTTLCGTSDKCKSVGYEFDTKTCHLFGVNSKDDKVRSSEVKGYDLYERNSMSYFTRISNHHLPINKKSEISTTSLEECSWKCISESTFDCYGFNHLRNPSTCFLINASPVERSLPAIYSETIDFYERTIDYDPMDNFLNIGSGMLFPFAGKFLYNQTIRGISVEQCAQRCLDERKFKCSSFDYLHDKDLNFCLLSDTSVMAGQANLSSEAQANSNHYERMDLHLRMFQPTLFSKSLVKKIEVAINKLPEQCAQLCVDEKQFICRSFDYQLDQGGTCLFSSESTGREESVVVRKDDNKIAAHHFDMKPVYVCGENLTLPSKLFSPGWPYKYPPNEDCIWRITASTNQIITLKFFHMELGDDGNCKENSGDRLLITEVDPDGQTTETICLASKTQMFVSRSNKISIRFISDRENEDFGFRASYSADWTCNAVLKKSPGEFATSGYPMQSYPSDTSCTWRLWSPNSDHRIRLDFPYFRLQEHPLGHCTENADHVKVMDGGSNQSPIIGVYCGFMPPFFVISGGRELLIQFKAYSDRRKEGLDERKKGFRALYVFEEEKGLNRTLFDRTKDINSLHFDSSLWNESVVGDDNSTSRNIMWSLIIILSIVSLILFISLLLLVRVHRKRKFEGSFILPWKTDIVSMKLLRSLKKMRKQDGDTNSNNLFVNSMEGSQDVIASKEDNCTHHHLHSSPSPQNSSSSKSIFSKYQRINDNNIYLGDENIFH